MGPAALAGRRVVVTQQRPHRLVAALREHGAHVDHVPLTEVAGPGDGGTTLLGALERLDEFDWLVVTSVNGARAAGAGPARARRVRLAAVGESTAEVLADIARRPVDLVPTVQRAQGLLDEFPRGPGTVLVAQGNLAGPAVVDGLRALGYDVTVVEAYRTVRRRPTEDDRSALVAADAVVLASGSAAQALDGAGFGGVLVAIGPSTARAARDLGLPIAAVAASASDDDVVAAVATALAT